MPCWRPGLEAFFQFWALPAVVRASDEGARLARERLVSRQFSCSSLMSALDGFDAQQFLDRLPDDPAELAQVMKDLLAS